VYHDRFVSVYVTSSLELASKDTVSAVLESWMRGQLMPTKETRFPLHYHANHFGER
jgi:hypothetical protein